MQFAIRSLRLNAFGLAFLPILSLVFPGEAFAQPLGGEELAAELDSQSIVHPLLSAEAADIARSFDGTTAELYRALEAFDTISEIDGIETVTSSVRLMEYEPLGIDIEAQQTHEAVTFVLTSTVQDWVDALSTRATDTKEVVVVFDRTLWDQSVSVQHQQALAMLEGTASTHGDLHRVRLSVVEERRVAGEAYLRQLRDDLEAAGAEVIEWNTIGGTAHIGATPEAITVLLANEAVRRVELPAVWSNDGLAGYSYPVIGTPLNGLEIQDMIQAVPLYLGGFRGRGEYIAVVESRADEIHNVHASFMDGPGGGASSSRVENCQGTSWLLCTFGDVSVGQDHATTVSSIIASDLTLGQDPSFPGIDAQRRRSGTARDSAVLGIEPTGTGGRLLSILPLYGVHIMSSSSTNEDGDEDCGGATGVANIWNDLFELGVFVVNSAGNNDTTSTTDCNVGDPGSAIGTFTANSTWVYETAQGHEEDILDAGSSRGGTLTEGYGRSVVDMMAPSGHNLRASHDGTAPNQYTNLEFFGSSAAAPQVASAAMLFRDWHHSVVGSAIDDPGRLFVNMLLMGDRAMRLIPEQYTGTAYPNIGGAGRLRLRTFDAAGLDGPAQWLTGAPCLPDGLAGHAPIYAGNPLPNGVDYIKAVGWWYDRSHGETEGNGHDEYELHLQEKVGGSWVNVHSDTSGDNKLRVFHTGDIGGRVFRLRFEGVNVNSDAEGCGLNSNRVYYSMLFEDNARNDDPTLSTYVRPEQ